MCRGCDWLDTPALDHRALDGARFFWTPEYGAASPRYTAPLAMFTVLRSSAEIELDGRRPEGPTLKE